MPDVFWMYFGCSTEVLRLVLLGVVQGGTTGSSTGVLLGVVPGVPDEYGHSTDVFRMSG